MLSNVLAMLLVSACVQAPIAEPRHTHADA